MKRVIVSPEAEAHVRVIGSWWETNRPLAPNLFVDELAEVFEMLRHFAGAGQRVPHASVSGVRRVLLRSSRYHVYYVESRAEVFVLAVWSAVRERGPDLRGL